MSALRPLLRLNGRKATTNLARTALQPARWYSSEQHSQEPDVDIDELLSKPSWSVRSLLPSAADATESTVTPAQLHHLLRLSALPQPKSPEEEEEMLKTLQSQLHFVKEIQSVDTTGVEPLQAIRDETEEGIKEATIGLDDLREAFADEEIKGRNRRPRRKRDTTRKQNENETQDWDALGTAKRTVAKFFVVNT